MAGGGGMINKITLFADDILLSQCLSKYGEMFGYKVNEGKSEVRMIAGNWPKQQTERWTFSGQIWEAADTLTKSSSQLYIANYDKIISQTRKDLERWEMLPLTGRVEAIRINVLPQLHFLFCWLPITVPVSTFKFLDRLVSTFIQDKSPRVKLKVLCSHGETGSSALPHSKCWFHGLG